MVCLHIEVALTMEIDLKTGGVEFKIPSLNTNHTLIELNVGQGLSILHIGSSLLYSTSKSFFLNNVLHAPEKKTHYQFISSQMIIMCTLNFILPFSVSRIHFWALSFFKDRVKMTYILFVLSFLHPPVQPFTSVKKLRFYSGMHA